MNDILFGYQKETANLSLLKNLGEFKFEDVSSLLPLIEVSDHFFLAMGFFDAENDGDLDIVLGRKLIGGPLPSGCIPVDDDYTCPPFVEVDANKGNCYPLSNKFEDDGESLLAAVESELR